MKEFIIVPLFPSFQPTGHDLLLLPHQQGPGTDAGVLEKLREARESGVSFVGKVGTCASGNRHQRLPSCQTSSGTRASAACHERFQQSSTSLFNDTGRPRSRINLCRSTDRQLQEGQDPLCYALEGLADQSARRYCSLGCDSAPGSEPLACTAPVCCACHGTPRDQKKRLEFFIRTISGPSIALGSFANHELFN